MTTKEFTNQDRSILVSLQAEFNDEYYEWRVTADITARHPIHPGDSNKRRTVEILEGKEQLTIQATRLRLPPAIFHDQSSRDRPLELQGDIALEKGAGLFAKLFADVQSALQS